jgi:hypothetical protein
MAFKNATFDNTKFPKWWKMYNAALAAHGLPPATEEQARGAYEVGETPDTAADYLAFA